MRCCQFSDPTYALGRAVDLLRRAQPFASYDFGKFSNVLMGQIKRGHYVFTLADDRAVGYVGWALCDEDTARAWIMGRKVPGFSQCLRGDCWVGITFFADSAKVCRFQARWCRDKYPGLKVFGIRDYGSRRRPTHLVNCGSSAGPLATKAPGLSSS